MLSRSQTEQRWPSSPALQSMFLGKTRIMSLENVSTHLLLFVGTSFVQSWVAGKALQTEGGPVSLSQRSPSQVLPKKVAAPCRGHPTLTSWHRDPNAGGCR